MDEISLSLRIEKISQCYYGFYWTSRLAVSSSWDSNHEIVKSPRLTHLIKNVIAK